MPFGVVTEDVLTDTFLLFVTITLEANTSDRLAKLSYFCDVRYFTDEYSSPESPILFLIESVTFEPREC
jgi:hypothetical protein